MHPFCDGLSFHTRRDRVVGVKSVERFRVQGFSKLIMPVSSDPSYCTVPSTLQSLVLSCCACHGSICTLSESTAISGSYDEIRQSRCLTYHVQFWSYLMFLSHRLVSLCHGRVEIGFASHSDIEAILHKYARIGRPGFTYENLTA